MVWLSDRLKHLDVRKRERESTIHWQGSKALIYYCPRCSVKVSDVAQFCPNCGLKRRGAQPVPAVPATTNAAQSPRNSEGTAPQPTNVPERGQEIPAIPKRTVQPNVRRVPVRPYSGNFPSQPVQPAPTA